MVSFSKNFLPVLLCLILSFVASCASEDPFLYERTGFAAGGQPEDLKDSSIIKKVAPDYYYRHPEYSSPYPQQNQQQAYFSTPQQQQNYQPQQAYQPQLTQQQQQAPQPQQVYQRQPASASSFYANPYLIPATPNANRHDGDQYYVPATYRNNMEQQNIPNVPSSY